MKQFLVLLGKFIPTIAQIVVVAIILVVGWVAFNAGARSGVVTPQANIVAAQPNAVPTASHPVDLNGDGEIYTCSMHPQILQDAPGDCPICGMDLVRMNVADASGEDDHSERQLTMSAQARALANIQTTTVTRTAFPEKHIRLVGQLAVDPTRRAHISVDIGGRIDGLYAEFEGAIVSKGENLVELYSPELLGVQKEFLQAIAFRNRLSENALESTTRTSQLAIDAARERLRLAGLQPEQIDAIAEQGQARQTIALRAPIGGTVVTRYKEEGEYVTKGERILTIADLSVVWGELAAYESDLQWLREGQQMTFTNQTFPGKVFHGTIDYIDPTLNPATRTARVRVNIDNPEGGLRPGMYVTGEVVVRPNTVDTPIIIPETAPLITGERAVVYVEVPGAERPTYEGREVVLGPHVEDGYVIVEGLAAGERIVTNGAFQIDSALQIVAKPSMMNPQGAASENGHGHVHEMPTTAPNEEHFAGVLSAYVNLQESLAADDAYEARAALIELQQVADEADINELHLIAAHVGPQASIDDLREGFHRVSRIIISLVREYGSPLQENLRLVHCPMAFDFAGADWLQTEAEILNPYFGAEMLSCGTIEQEWPHQ